MMEKTITNLRSRTRLRRQKEGKKGLTMGKGSRYQDPQQSEREQGPWLAKELIMHDRELRRISSLGFRWLPSRWVYKRTIVILRKVIPRREGNSSQQARGAKVSSRHQGWLTARIKPAPPTCPQQMMEDPSRRAGARSQTSSWRPSRSQQPILKAMVPSHSHGRELRVLEAKTQDCKTNTKLNRLKIHFNWVITT